MQKSYLFSVTCPFCGKVHEFQTYGLTVGQSVLFKAAAPRFLCCGYEIGFSVRRCVGGAA